MLFAFTDFHRTGPYSGEIEAAARRHCNTAFVHLMHDAPAFDPGAAGQLLAALKRQFHPGDVCIAVVDPGVGGARYPVALKADGCWFVGPDNGLFSAIAAHAKHGEWWEITWRPESLSNSFHGRDLFAPFAGRLASGQTPTAIGAQPLYDPVTVNIDSERVVYIDGFGNCVTGIAADSLSDDDKLLVNQQPLPHAFTFSSVPSGNAFWYRNSMGLVEIAINQASAAATLGLQLGSKVKIQKL
jgi:S-adenosyl-L-methionine hydrolase (adenosine-forming)